MDSEDAAPIADAPEPSAEPPAADAGAPEAPQERQTVSLEDAFAQASAAAEAPAPSTSGEPPAGDTPPAEPQADASGDVKGSAPEPKPVTAQSVLDRISTLVSQGREGDLSPREQGVLRKLRDDAVTSARAEAQEMESYKDLYLQLEATRVEDPVEFARQVKENPERATFMQAFEAEYPEVTLENPNPGARQPSLDQVRNQAASKIFDDFDQVVRAMAAEAGVDNNAVEEARKGAAGPWSYLTSVFTASVKAAVQKELPKIRAEERKAASLEAQAQYTGKTIVTPRVLGSPASGKPERGNHRTTMEEAMTEAISKLA